MTPLYRDALIRASQLSMSHTFYLVTLNKFQWDKADAWPAQETIACVMNAGISSVRKWQSELEVMGILFVDSAINKGGEYSNRYRINFEKLIPKPDKCRSRRILNKSTSSDSDANATPPPDRGMNTCESSSSERGDPLCGRGGGLYDVEVKGHGNDQKKGHSAELAVADSKIANGKTNDNGVELGVPSSLMPEPEIHTGSTDVDVPAEGVVDGHVSIGEVINAWNETFETRVRITPKRTSMLKVRCRDPWWVENWRDALTRARMSPGCCGQNDRGWIADIDWFLKPDTVTKISEGKYDGWGTKNSQAGRHHEREAANAAAIANAAASISRGQIHLGQCPSGRLAYAGETDTAVDRY